MGYSSRVNGLYDAPMWQAMRAGELRLQQCRACAQFRYPPAPVCPHCLDENAEWRALSGVGVIVSWVVFHRQYFEDFPAPHCCIAVRLDEGPLIVTTLDRQTPSQDLTGRRVRLYFGDHAGHKQHYARLV
jgi:uncharacterized OB-fold protein